MAEARTISTTIKKPKVRWLRLVAQFIVTFAIVAGLHGAWGVRAERKLTARAEQLRAAGERVRPKDFVIEYTGEPYRANGAPDILSAAAIVNDVGPERRSLDFLPTTMPSNPAVWPHLARARDWYEPAMRRVERAQAKPDCLFDRNLASPVSENLRLPGLNATREVSNVVALTAMVEHHEGRHDRVVRRLGQMLYLADVNEGTPASIGHSVALGIGLATAWRVELLAPELRIGAADGHAPVDDVRKLVAALADERTTQAGFDNALQADRMTTMDRIDSIARGVTSNRHEDFEPVLRYVLRPYFYDNARVAVEHATEVIAAVRGAADWPTAKERLTHVPEIPKKYLFADVFTYDYARDVRSHFISLTDRRLAATALAIRLYQHDHNGARPQRLDELVPNYLPAVPLDAMAAGGKPIGYLPRAEHPVLYSVGRDGIDESANEKPMPHEFGEIDEWRRLDRVFYLSGRVREVIYIERPKSPAEIAAIDAMPAALAPAPGEWEPGAFTGPPWEEPPPNATTEPAWPAQPASAAAPAAP